MASPVYNMNIESLYIPRVEIQYGSHDIINMFHLLEVGYVTRVDIIPIKMSNKKYDYNKEYNSVFIYIDFYTKWLKENPTLFTYPSYRLWINDRKYWTLLKNKNPFPNTILNIHQIAENTRILEEKLETQMNIIKELKNKIFTLENINLHKNFDDISELVNDLTSENNMMCTINTCDISDQTICDYDDLEQTLIDDEYADMPSLISVSVSRGELESESESESSFVEYDETSY